MEEEKRNIVSSVKKWICRRRLGNQTAGIWKIMPRARSHIILL